MKHRATAVVFAVMLLSTVAATGVIVREHPAGSVAGVETVDVASIVKTGVAPARTRL